MSELTEPTESDYQAAGIDPRDPGWRAIMKADRDAFFGPATPPTSPPAPEAPQASDDPVEAARQRGTALLEAQEQRQRDLKIGKALIVEQIGDVNFENWSEEDILTESGLLITEQQKREQAQALQEAALLANPALLEQALKNADLERLVSGFWTDFPNEQARRRRCEHLGVDYDLVKAEANKSTQWKGAQS